VGYNALDNNKTGYNNTAIGYGANTNLDYHYNATAIGYQAIVTASNRVQLGNTDVSNVKTSGTLTAGTVTYPNTLGTANQVLSNTGSGTLTWATIDAGTLSGTTLKSTITGSSLTSVGTLANLTVTNPIVGSITGNAATATSATTANTAGTASTATKLATSRNINGVAFDGSGDITITSSADAGALTGTTLASNIISSSLTSVGTIASLTTGSITNRGKVIVGASSAASASAVLEASSTTQGFLPPRMNASQRNAISSPATGLIIFCNNCSNKGQMQYFNGTAWVDMVGNAAAGVYTPTVGSSYQGGIVAYVLASGDPGYDANTPHGLIVATSDQSTGIYWYNRPTYTITGATGTAIGTGLSNTNAIIASQGEIATSYAAGLARAYTGGGYTDWYLPSKDELNKLYINQTAIGGFTSTYYWSSSEVDQDYAWSQLFSVFWNGYQNQNDKGVTNFYVRAIRSF
jgi:hypothetical protein